MKKMKRNLRTFCSFLVFFISVVGYAQTVNIKGTVVDNTGQGVPGVNVVVKGTTNGSVTNLDGAYQLLVEDGQVSTLVFSFIGFKTQEVQVDGRTTIDITMSEDTEVLEDVVVVGYGSQSKKSVVAAISQVDSEELKQSGTVTNVADALSGTMPGVNVMTSTGLPGFRNSESLGDKPGHGGESEILIRGMGTWNNSSPLVLVDGVEREMNDLDINEIDKISVLKDASATAVYGVKGANGVILITTKVGKEGKAKVNVEANFAFKKISKIDKAVGSYEGLIARNYAIVNDLPVVGESDFAGLYYSTRILNYFRDDVDPEKYTNVDWHDTMLKDYAKSQNYNVNISGGTSFVKYFTSIAYLHDGDILDSGPNERGYSPAFNYDRVNFRTNLDFDITKSTKLKLNLSGYHGEQKTPGTTIWGLFSSLYTYNPNSPLPQYSDGVYGMEMVPGGTASQDNSWFRLNTNGVQKTHKSAVTTDVQLTQDLDFITKGLSVKGKFSFDNIFYSWGRNITDDTDESKNTVRKYYDVNSDKWEWWIPVSDDGFDFYPEPITHSNESINAGAAKRTSRNIYYEFALNYKRTFKEHRVSGLALFSRQETTTGSAWPTKREDWVGRLTYDYSGRYLVEVNAAYNGSERFGPDYKFDLFPSLALGWRLSEENFMKENAKFISNLKFRYSMGLIGDDRISGVGKWPYLTVWTDGGSKAYLGNGQIGSTTPYPTAAEGTPGNYDIHWEQSRKQNFGLEYGFFDDLITGTVDYYTDHRTDMLIGGSDRSVPDYYGTTPTAANIGIVDSHGLEFLINVRKKIGEVDLYASYNWTFNDNEIKEKDEPQAQPAYQKEEGYAINQTRGMLSTGIISSWDEMYTGVVNENIATNYQTLPGDGRGLDFNADGVINSLDAIAYGYTVYPHNTYGFNLGGSWKGLAFDVRFTGAYNTTMPTESVLVPFGSSVPRVMQEILDDTYTPEYGVENPGYPSLKMPTRTPATFQEYSRDGSYLRLKTAQISYNLPTAWVKKLRMSRCQIFVNGNNLLLWNHLPFDKEGYGGNAIYRQYPNVKQFNIGTKISF